MNDAAALPAYEPMLDAYHRAFREELRRVVDDLPLQPGHAVLDAACGDGFYAGLLATAVGPAGAVTACDASDAYLSVARSTGHGGPGDASVRFVSARLERTPFADATFDAVWCAQSLYSLPDPSIVLREMRRVLKPGGFVAILENDLLHHVLLPWPEGAELAARVAEARALERENGSRKNFFAARRMGPLLASTGFSPGQFRTYAHVRQAPLDEDTRAFLTHYLRRLAADAGPFLDAQRADEVLRWIDPSSAEGLLNEPDAAVTFLDGVYLGWAGADARRRDGAPGSASTPPTPSRR